MESGIWYVNFSPYEIGKVMDKKKLFLEKENFNSLDKCYKNCIFL